MTDVTSQTFRRWREAKGWGAPAVQAQPEIVHLVALLDRETAAPFAGSLEDALRKLAAGASAAGPRCTVAAAQRSRWGFSQRGSELTVDVFNGSGTAPKSALGSAGEGRGLMGARARVAPSGAHSQPDRSQAEPGGSPSALPRS